MSSKQPVVFALALAAAAAATVPVAVTSPARAQAPYDDPRYQRGPGGAWQGYTYRTPNGGTYIGPDMHSRRDRDDGCRA